MRLEQRFNRPDPAARQWQGDAEYDHEEYARRASRFHAGNVTPSAASSAVVETVYRKPRTYADIHEYDARSQVIDRVPTAVGFHSFDSMDDIKSRHSRYEIELDSVDNRLDLDWVVKQIPDLRDASDKEEGVEELQDDAEREQPREEEVQDERIAVVPNEELITDIGRYGADMTIDESFESEDSDSCPAVWISESQENIRFHKKDYNEALEDAKRLKGLNAVQLVENENPLTQLAKQSSKRMARRGRKTSSYRKKAEDVDSVNSLVDKDGIGSGLKQTTKQAAGWNRWRPHFRRDNWSVSSKSGQSRQGTEELPGRASTPVTTASTQNESKVEKPAKARSTGPVDLDEIPTAGTSKEEPKATKTSSTSQNNSFDVMRSNENSGENPSIACDTKYKMNASKSRTSNGSSKSGESRESLRQRSLVENFDELSNPPVAGCMQEDSSVKNQDDAQNSLQAEGNSLKGIPKEVALDPPGADNLTVLEKRSSGKSSGRRSPQTDSESYNTEGDSYASSDREVSNDDVIKAVRGEKTTSEDPVTKNIDGFTSWIISGFDALASTELKTPIGFLDWSRETRLQEDGVVHGDNEGKVDPSQTPQFDSIIQSNQNTTKDSNMPTNDDTENMILSPRSQSGSRSRSKSKPRRQMNDENQQKTANTGNSPRATRTSRGPNKFLVGEPGLVRQRIQTIASRELQEAPPADALIEQQKQEEIKTAPSKGSAQVKSLILESGVEVKVPDTTEQQIKQRNREVLERRSKKLLRDNVSVSSIEIPTPNRAKTDDEYSVSILGLRKGERAPSIEEAPVSVPEETQKSGKIPSAHSTKQRSVKKDGAKKSRSRSQRKVDDQQKSTTKVQPKHRRRSQSPHQSKSRGKSPSVRKRQEKTKSKGLKSNNIKQEKNSKKTFSIFGRKKE